MGETSNSKFRFENGVRKDRLLSSESDSALTIIHTTSKTFFIILHKFVSMVFVTETSSNGGCQLKYKKRLETRFLAFCNLRS